MEVGDRAAFGTNGTRRGVSVGDGKVYTLADGNRVVALNKDTGDGGLGRTARGPGGASLGNIAKVATVYHDGMVYVRHQRRQPRRGVRGELERRQHRLALLRRRRTAASVVTDVNGNTVDAGATWGPCADGTTAR